MVLRSAHQIWEAALGELQVQVSQPNYRTWLEKTTGVSNQDNQFVVGVPNIFVAEYLDKNQRSLIEKTMIGLAGADIKVIFQVSGKPPARPPRNGSSGKFNPRYTFDSFIASTLNRLAKEAALTVIQNPGRYNPLFIYGESGLGKTHLLQAIGQVALTRHLQVLYASAEQFTNEFVSAIRERKTGDFNSRYRAVDMLLIDDIQFIVGKEQTEESFFHIFNELHNTNRQIVMTSDRPPKSLPLLEERLSSRFEWGLTASIRPPDYQTRLAILKTKAESTETRLSLPVLELIASRDCHDVRQLEGALNRVTAYASLVQSEPTPELATAALQDVARREPSPSLTPDKIVEAVAANFQLTADDLKGKNRGSKEIALARHLAMYVMRKETNGSLTEIGRELGGRNHSSVFHACESIEGALESNLYLKRKLADIYQSMAKNRK